jgi:hypothetical protein
MSFLFSGILRELRAWNVAKACPAPQDVYYALAAAAAGPPPPNTSALRRSATWPRGHHAAVEAKRLVLPSVLAALRGDLPSPTFIGPSTLGPNAGLGLFSSRPLRMGELVAIYPGVIYGSRLAHTTSSLFDRDDDNAGVHEDVDEDVRRAAAATAAAAPPSAYVLRRPDGLRIDAGSVAGRANCERLAIERTPWALGHIANHPAGPTIPDLVRELRRRRSRSGGGGKEGSLGTPASTTTSAAAAAPSNGIPFSLLDMPIEIPIEGGEGEGVSLAGPSLHRAPYAWAPKPLLGGGPSSSSAVPTDGIPDTIPGVVFLATRDLNAGEELFLDYGFMVPNRALPPWYAPVAPSAHWRVLLAACERAAVPPPPDTPRGEAALEAIDRTWVEAMEATG